MSVGLPSAPRRRAGRSSTCTLACTGCALGVKVPITWLGDARSRAMASRISSEGPMGWTMDRGLYLAASGMLAEQLRQDQIANDLSNSSTSGYKAERTTQQSFGKLLLTNSVTGATVGSQSTGVQVTNTVTDWTPGALKDTGEPLDMAINGDGFFAVQTDAGVRYTRNGEF